MSGVRLFAGQLLPSTHQNWTLGGLALSPPASCMPRLGPGGLKLPHPCIRIGSWEASTTPYHPHMPGLGPGTWLLLPTCQMPDLACMALSSPWVWRFDSRRAVHCGQDLAYRLVFEYPWIKMIRGWGGGEEGTFVKVWLIKPNCLHNHT